MNRRFLINFDLKNISIHRCDFLIIGGGIAGLTAAFIAGDELETTILTKGMIKQSSTWFAQGGIAAAIGESDSSESHYQDTMAVGANLGNPLAVKVMVEEAREAIDFLINLGADFDHDNGKLRLAREGGHSEARVLHAGDGTGSVIASTLGKAVSNKRRQTLLQNRFVLDLLTNNGRCIGALVFDSDNGTLEAHLSEATMLATGGTGQLFDVTTNPVLATGDGFAMAGRAGAMMEGLEFIQFHPTSFCADQNPRFLISEALRGEGAYLRDGSGNRFMVGVHRLAELAPRDVVCREIVSVMKQEGHDHVFLDATHLEVTKVRTRFPGIYKYLKDNGYDLNTDLVPVSPAAHYMIGGVNTDLYCRTGIERLYSCGEVAFTGVHGANRLASNSLLEGLVFSRRATYEILEENFDRLTDDDLSITGSSLGMIENETLLNYRINLKKLMTENAGITRRHSGLNEAKSQILTWQDELSGRQFDNASAWEVQNMIYLAEMIIDQALTRRESVGAHFMLD